MDCGYANYKSLWEAPKNQQENGGIDHDYENIERKLKKAGPRKGFIQALPT